MTNIQLKFGAVIMKRSFAASIACLLSFVSTNALAQAACPSQASTLAGGQVYVRQGETGIPLSAMLDYEGKARRSVEMFYVIKSFGERAGAIVIKRARLGLLIEDDDPRVGRVKLARTGNSIHCPSPEPAYSGSISIRSYDDYHDHGLERSAGLSEQEPPGTARDQLRSFHTSYKTSNGCKATDSKYGSDGFYAARNNRSQFSFNSRIVDFGMREPAYDIAARTFQAVSEFVITPVQAVDRQQLRERSVEIKPYQTVNSFACVAFTVDARLPKQMLRVNDLEGPQTEGEPREIRFGPGGKRKIR